MNKKLLLAIVVIVLAGAAYWVWNLRDSGDTKADAPPANKATTVEKSATTPPSKEPELDKPAPEAPHFRSDKDPKGTLRLEGVVFDEDDQPLGGATIVINSNPSKTTVSRAGDGFFAFDDLIGRTYTVSARSGANAAGPVRHVLTDKSEPVVLKMKKAAEILVEVVEDSGRPVAGASVELRALVHQSQTSDSDGKARFEGASAGHHWVVASASSLAPARTLVSVPSGSGVSVRARITMSRGVPVSGVVVDHGGKPVVGALVGARPAAKIYSGLDLSKDGVKSDGRGRFTIPAVAAGSHRFFASLEGYPTAQTEPISIAGDSAFGGVEIRFEEAAKLSGRVVEGSETPVPWAQVRVIGDPAAGSRGISRQATADEDGRFEIRGLPRQKIVAIAQAETATSEASEVDLEAKAEQDVTLELTITAVIAGRVVTSGGEPVGEAQVVAMPDFWGGGDMKEFALRGVSSVRTDPGGNFSFAGIPDGAYRVRASRSAMSQSMWLEPGTKAKAGDTNVRVILDPEGGVKGQLVTKNGEHPELFTVRPRFPPGIPVVAEDGEFEVRDLSPGHYDITFQGPTFAETTVRDVEIKPGQIFDMGRVEVVRGRIISGTVRNAGGSAVEGAKVAAGQQLIGDGTTAVSAFGDSVDQAQGTRTATADRDGRYRLYGVGHGELVLVAEHASAGRSLGVHIPAQEADSEIDVHLRPFGSAAGKVTVGGKQTQGVQVLATTPEASGNLMNVVVTGKNGSFVFERLPAGDYVFKAISGAMGSAQTGSTSATIKGKRRAMVDINIDIGDISIEIAINGKGGAKIDAAQMFLFTGMVEVKTGKEMHEKFVQAGGNVQMTFAQAGKNAAFSKLRPGEHTICAIPIGGDLTDPTFMKRLQEHRMDLAVYCSKLDIAGSPKSQKHSIEVPPMTPLPE